MEELAWFYEAAPTWDWTWAKTFEGGAEHSYVYKGKNLDPVTYERAFMLSQALGVPKKFYRRVNIELECPDLTMEYGKPGQTYTHTGFKFWPMSHQRSVNKSFNVAPLGMTYGVQDAPDTTTLVESPWDMTAGDWDDWRLAAVGEDYAGLASKVFKEVMGERHVPSLLDLGPRIGFALDMNLASKHVKYRAVEPSQGLLNVLLFRHQWVRDIRPVHPDEYMVEQRKRVGWNTAVALLGTASYLSPDTIRELPSVVRHLNLMFYITPEDDWFGPLHLPSTAKEALQTAAALPGATVKKMGRYAMVKVDV